MPWRSLLIRAIMKQVLAAGLGLWLVRRILWRIFRDERQIERTENPWK